MTTSERIDFEDEELVRRIARKDSAAFESFYDRYYRVAFALVLRIVRVRQDAEDVLAEAFWQVWRQADRYAPERGKPLAWLLTIARTRAIDSLRASGRRGLQQEADERQSAETSDDPFVTAGVRVAVTRCLEALSHEQRAPLELAYFQGMSHTEIAAALSQPLGTMKDRIRSAMIQLRKCLKPFEASA